MEVCERVDVLLQTCVLEAHVPVEVGVCPELPPFQALAEDGLFQLFDVVVLVRFVFLE